MAIISKGNHTSQEYRTAYILINSDESPYGKKITSEHIAEVLKVNTKTVDRAKQRFVEEGFETCLGESHTPKKDHKDRWRF